MSDYQISSHPGSYVSVPIYDKAASLDIESSVARTINPPKWYDLPDYKVVSYAADYISADVDWGKAAYRYRTDYVLDNPGGLMSEHWEDLLEPFGYLPIDITYSTYSGGYPLNVTVVLRPSSPEVTKQNEWLVRTDLLMQAAGAVEAVKGAGFSLEEAPSIELGGRYMFQAGNTEPEYYSPAGSVSMKIRKA